MIGIGRQGVTGSLSPAELSRLRSSMARRNFLLLPGFVDPDFLALIQWKIGTCEFRDTLLLDGRAGAQEPAQTAAASFLSIMFGDRRLCDFVEAVLDVGPIASEIIGNIFRTNPGTYPVDWHTDLDGLRAAEMVVNLCPKPIRGGVVEIRTRPERRPLGEIPYKRAGDMLLIRVREDLEHRAAPLKGSEPKTIATFWFQRAA